MFGVKFSSFCSFTEDSDLPQPQAVLRNISELSIDKLQIQKGSSVFTGSRLLPTCSNALYTKNKHSYEELK